MIFLHIARSFVVQISWLLLHRLGVLYFDLKDSGAQISTPSVILVVDETTFRLSRSFCSHPPNASNNPCVSAYFILKYPIMTRFRLVMFVLSRPHLSSISVFPLHIHEHGKRPRKLPIFLGNKPNPLHQPPVNELSPHVDQNLGIIDCHSDPFARVPASMSSPLCSV